MEKDQNPVDSHRRGFLLGAVSAASVLATGCGSPLPAKLHEQDSCTRGTSSYLGGKEVADAWKAPYRYIDAHAHFFNASDVPAHGFLAGSFMHGRFHNPVLLKIAGGVSAAVEALANTALDPLNEMQLLCQRTVAVDMRSEQSTGTLDAEIEREKQKNASNLHRQLQSTDVPARVNEMLRQLRETVGAQHLAHQRFSEDLVFDSARGVGLLKDSAPPVPAALKGMDMQNVLRAGTYMLGPRHHSLREYIKLQARHSPDALMSASIGAMVDFNYWLRGAGRATNIHDQVLIQEQLALMSGGFLLPVVAYNPWTDMKEGGESSRLVKWAVEHHGCVGVKIYPPIGFYPFGNGNLERPTHPERTPHDLRALDKTLEKFYGLCEELDVPVMAHGNDSNGRNQSENMLAGTAGWKELDRLPSLQRLYVNIGHFGGALDHPVPGGKPPEDWTMQYAQLMQSAGKLKVFGDIGYWDDLYGETNRESVRAKLRRVLPMPLPGGQTVADRVMYGSDWFMTAKERDWEAYPRRILDELRGIASEDVVQRIMGGNVLECYGLAAGSNRRNRLRLEAYYQQPGRQVPGWMGRVRPLSELRALGA